MIAKILSMTIQANTPEEYLELIPPDKKAGIVNLRETLLKALPAGFSEVIQYGMLSYVVPHALYPPGYHCTPHLPLPFISLAAQKNFIALYHMGLYGDPGLLAWFQEEYARHTPQRLDMGKSCIRFKRPDMIPYALIGELARKISPSEWITRYEMSFKR